MAPLSRVLDRGRHIALTVVASFQGRDLARSGARATWYYWVLQAESTVSTVIELCNGVIIFEVLTETDRCCSMPLLADEGQAG